MSDYISKSVLIEDVHKIRCQNGISEEVGHNRPLTDIANVFECINNQPTLDETEIIRKPLERVVERLEEKKQEYLEGFRVHQENELYGVACGFGDSIKILKEECGINERD